jgi:uncharacterized protein (DUF1697 family)
MWVALLRAVNLGSRNKVPMAPLRELMASDGYRDVRTLIASGNVVFERARPSAAALERLIAAELGVTTTVILRSAAQVEKLAAARPPFDETVYVAFATDGRDIVFPRSARRSAAEIEKELGVQVTVRNWNTVEKLARLVRA